MTTQLSDAELRACLHEAMAGVQPGDTSAPVLIAGGGIGGLAAALALARRDIASHVLERRSSFSEAGAGIQIGPNGVHVLRALGVAETLAPHAGVPDAILVHDAISGAILARLPLGPSMEAKFGAPYWVVHREDLHAALHQHAAASPHVSITHDADVRLAASGSSTAGIATADGRSFIAPAVIGADGLRSRVAAAVPPVRSLVSFGKSAWRSVIPASALPPALDCGCVHIWLRNDAHVVHYPLRGGSEVAVIVIADDAFVGEGWSYDADPTPLTSWLRLAPQLADLLHAPSNWRKWALMASLGPMHLTSGRIALLGDAAHPVLPFLAQGGVLALEDATVLAHVLATGGRDVTAALQSYAIVRRPRAERIAQASRRNGRVYHLRGPAAAARNLTLRGVPGQTLMAAYDWIYGWRSP